jgi:hypothetical protein
MILNEELFNIGDHSLYFWRKISSMAAYNSHTDAELTDLLKSDDHAAFTKIYDRYNGLLHVF